MDTPRLLVLDDHADTRLLIAHVCPSSWHLTPCATCAEARSVLTTQRFDLLVFDIRLPDGSGFDVLHFARNHHTSCNKDVPAVAITAMGYPNPEVQLFRKGFDEYISKPFVQSDLMALFHKHELTWP
ncbi:response regulator transcription factor [Longimonas halophila]|uniref:response regulator transcription factor n=1 Tax=Longimonas halophila TaxID=1469170 RepID=UPI001596B0FE